ncbi:MAG TPA: class I SAM-dependent methyltransferase [Polyangiaceae bacterium]|jgi:SAM-dependent methyltransferase|nr:class I SAM-dependent methyltransferase [Polyangiaceae bacterium]
MDLVELPESARERHPWERSRARAIERIVRSSALTKVGTILDYGCGDAYTGRALLERLHAEHLVGLDVNLSEAQRDAFAGGDSRVLLASDATALGERRFDLVLLCDVIEHVEDDGVLLRMAREYLNPGGRVVVTVPAFQSLFTEHDRTLKHFRRYSLSELERSVARAGLTVESSGYLFASLLPARAAGKLLELARGARNGGEGLGGWRGGKALSKLLGAALFADNSLLLSLSELGIKMPGLSAWALCR